ncbi:MAG TPA: GntG family PLP-dependent aldolase [Clostridia bacterium]|nr:GntG family PLP-dependent aldolase [Clostridia bacterium]
MKVIDLRSDTVTLPTPRMLKEMVSAPLGDDGRAKGSKGEDPTVVKLERMAAERFGKEDALFVPSGTMGNMVCLMTLAKRGESVVVAQNTHLYKSEKANFDPDFCGLIPVFVPQSRGVYCLDTLKKTLESKKIAAVCIENSYNFEGGSVISREKIRAILNICNGFNVPVHLDGARIFNAAAALSMEVKELTEGVTSLMFCVSKGLCAPIGSLILGSYEFIAGAREIRKEVGGQLRQVGILAAAGIVALEEMSERVSHDNIRARRLAEGIKDAGNISIDMDNVQTNIVKVDMTGDIDGKDFLKRLEAEKKVRGHFIDSRSIRLVTYHGITDEDIDEAIIRIKDFCAAI